MSLTNSEAFHHLAARRCLATFLANEETNQVGIRFRFDGHSQEVWFNTQRLNREDGPLLEAIRGLCGIKYQR